MQPVPEVQVRAARPEDLRAVVSLCEEHAAFERAPFSPEGKTEALRRALFHTPPRAWCLVAECSTGIVGYAVCTCEFSTWMAREYLHLDCLYLSASHRRAGLGSRIVAEVRRVARELGCQHIEWQTPAWNSNATCFYDRLGAISSQKLRYTLSH